ncbi:SprT-like family-domain-containing protein [Cladochytrium replicatum]|nr:SprT-like family-domain-containing protein [Cladochytrium replicatum]
MRLSACISAVFQHLSVTRQPRRPQPHLDLMDPHDLDDPNPDIHSLFLAFNEMYFEGKLSAVEVRWSPKMTLCAGTCHFFGGRYCSVRLSEPLLKFRPRSDLINTLLHESIHAYLFITGGNTDRDGHGPAFLELADRINKKAGTNITVYHSFRDEVNLYRTHVWKCNGCEHILRRAMNRPPQPADRCLHQRITNAKQRIRPHEIQKGHERMILLRAQRSSSLSTIGSRKENRQMIRFRSSCSMMMIMA